MANTIKLLVYAMIPLVLIGLIIEITTLQCDRFCIGYRDVLYPKRGEK